MSNTVTPGKPVRLYQKDHSFADFSTEEVVARGFNKFSGWLCGAGVENLCIDFDGNIQTASCGCINGKNEKGKLGNIFQEFTLPTNWLVCPQNLCSCGADLFIPKIKNTTYKNHLLIYNGQPEVSEKKNESVVTPIALERTFSTKCKQVFWEIGRRCNYNCSYCHPFVHNTVDKDIKYDSLILATQKIMEFSKGRPISFAITGGEPTINPDFLPWVKHLTKEGHHVSSHSNGSQTINYYLELINYSDLNISVHFEFYSPEKMLTLFQDLAKEIFLRKVALCPVGHLEVMLMMLPGKKEEIFEFERKIWKLPYFKEHCTLTIMPIRDHQSIEIENNISGDALLYYQEEELQLSGNRTEKTSLAREDDFIFYDHLDKLNNPETRERFFTKLKKSTIHE